MMTNKTKRRDPFANLQAQAPIDLIPSPEKKKQRDRSWERKNKPYSYKVPRHLWEAARQVRADLLSIAQYDADGHAREDRTTVDSVTAVLMDWALTQVEKDPTLLDLRPNLLRGRITVAWDEWSANERQPIRLLPPRKKAETKNAKHLVISCRWGNVQIDQRLKILAGEGVTTSAAVTNPFKYAVPVGELMVKLLQLAIEGYKARRFTMKIQRVAVEQTVDGWGRARAK